MKKNHIVKSFRINSKTKQLFDEVSRELGLRKSDLSRFLFNRGLKSLHSQGKAKGWDNIFVSVVELK